MSSSVARIWFILRITVQYSSGYSHRSLHPASTNRERERECRKWKGVGHDPSNILKHKFVKQDCRCRVLWSGWFNVPWFHDRSDSRWNGISTLWTSLKYEHWNGIEVIHETSDVSDVSDAEEHRRMGWQLGPLSRSGAGGDAAMPFLWGDFRWIFYWLWLT